MTTYRILFLTLFALVLGAQETVDHSSALKVIPWTMRYDFPGKCAPSQRMTLITGSYGSNDYVCGLTNNWIQITGGGGGGAPTGAAGGGLSGTYPNPGVAGFAAGVGTLTGPATSGTISPTPGANGIPQLDGSGNLSIGATVLNPTLGDVLPIVACVGAPGNTTGPYQSLCDVPSTGALYACKNAAGCTVAADWASQGSAQVYPGAGIGNSTGSAWGASYGVSGSGSVCLTVSCVMTTPNIGVATATSINGVSAATIAFLDATSSIQTQINTKAPTASPTFTGTVGGITAAMVGAAPTIGSSSVTTLGTIGTGVWQGTAVADTYIASAATWNAKAGTAANTFTGIQTLPGTQVNATIPNTLSAVPLIVPSTYISGRAVPLLGFYTSDNNPTLLKAEISGYMDGTNGGSILIGGSNSFGSGIATAMMAVNGTGVWLPATTTGSQIIGSSGFSGGAVPSNHTILNLYDISNGAFIVDQTFSTAYYSLKRGGTEQFRLDSSGISFTPLMVKYNNVSTAGMGVAPVYASIASSGNTSSIATTNLQCGGSVCAAGTYRVHIYTVVTTTGSGTLGTTIGWNDGTAARTSATAGVATTATNFEQADVVVRADGTNNITYATTLSSSGTYSEYVTLERLQ